MCRLRDKMLQDAGVLGVPTIIASLVAHAACRAAWHWPLLSRPADFRPGGYLVILGLIPALAAHIAAFALIGATRPCTAFECEDSTLAKQIGCIMGYTSITCGFITALLQGSTPVLVLTMCLMVFAMTALAAGSAPLTAGRRCLCFSTILSDAVLVGFVVLLLLEQHLITINYQIPQALFALAEYSSFVATPGQSTCFGLLRGARRSGMSGRCTRSGASRSRSRWLEDVR
ncbi:hypothetical protein AK812_SmicGene6099 [Symbiodinium microadriaticum]|uniref:Uncharacterized protein n=1 Tax=Symbiodinium microadriaticum TaxID=2951 RepID=A0A1Q9ES59_SYMMI|nr:hypothetical protein AK812_SmicGene6099 [Symbiodinium microadriaticum]